MTTAFFKFLFSSHDKKEALFPRFLPGHAVVPTSVETPIVVGPPIRFYHSSAWKSLSPPTATGTCPIFLPVYASGVPGTCVRQTRLMLRELR